MAITTNVYHFDVIRGDSDIHEIVVKNTDGTVKDITAASSIRYTIREYGSWGTVVSQKTLGAGIAIVDGVNGKLQRTLTYADTEVFVAGRTYAYDCEVTIGSERKTVQQGRISIVGDVSYTA